MTIRQCYEYILVECNKVKAPQVLLEDFIYLFNKAIQQYINGVLNGCSKSENELYEYVTKIVNDFILLPLRIFLQRLLSGLHRHLSEFWVFSKHVISFPSSQELLMLQRRFFQPYVLPDLPEWQHT